MLTIRPTFLKRNSQSRVLADWTILLADGSLELPNNRFQRQAALFLAHDESNERAAQMPNSWAKSLIK